MFKKKYASIFASTALLASLVVSGNPVQAQTAENTDSDANSTVPTTEVEGAATDAGREEARQNNDENNANENNGVVATDKDLEANKKAAATLAEAKAAIKQNLAQMEGLTAEQLDYLNGLVDEAPNAAALEDAKVMARAENLVANNSAASETPAEETQPEAQASTYKLALETANTRISQEYEAETAEQAERHFRNYVNENGLGDLSWDYDAASQTFTVTDGQSFEEPAAEEQPVEETDITSGFDTLDKAVVAVVAAETAIANDDVNNGYDISLGADGKYYVQLTPEANNELENLFDFNKEEEKPAEETDITAGFDTLADAFVAAEEAIINDDVNNGYDISLGADGKYYIQLQVEPNNDLENLFDFNKKEDKADEDFVFDPSVGYDNLADAFIAAETAIANDDVNNGYNISLGADDKYYIQLTPQANNELENLFDFDKLNKEEDSKADSNTASEKQAELERRINNLEEVVKALEAAQASQQAEIDEIKANLANLSDKVAGLKQRLASLEKEVAALEEKVAKCAPAKVKEAVKEAKEDKTKKLVADTKKDDVKVKVVDKDNKDQADQKAVKTVAVEKDSALPQTGAATAGLGLGAAAIVAGLGLAVTNKRKDQ